MLKVLDHPLGARSRTVQLHAQLIPRLLLSFALYLFAVSHILAVAAQDVVNGQDSTRGFSILDNPGRNSVLKVGSDAGISIDVSAFKNTGLGLDLLEVYLVSSEAQKNVTVSSGPQLLYQEPGSTVKHIHWSVPACLQAGAYNLTLYEASHLNDTSYFAITPVPVQIQNTVNVTDACDSPENALQVQPQPSSPSPPDIFSDTTTQSGALPSDLPDLNSTASASQTIAPSDTATATASGNVTASTTSSDVTATAQPSSSGGSIITITAGDGDITVGITDLPGTIVIEPSGGGPSETMVASSTGFVTIFKTVAPTATATLTEIISVPVTITLEETYVSTVTASGTTEEFTVTQTVLSTTELVATQISSPQQAGLLPINSGSMTSLPSAILFQTWLLASAFLYVLWPLLWL